VEGLYGKTISLSIIDDDIETQISVIKSYLVFQKVAEKLKLLPNKAILDGSPLQSKMIPVIETLQAKVEVERDNYAHILNITVTDTNAVFAQRLANTVALTYREFHTEQQMKRTTEAIKYIEDQLRKIRQKLQESEDEFNRFSQDNQLISIDMQTEDLLVRTREIQNEIRWLREDKWELEGILQRLKQFVENPTGSSAKFHSKKADNEYQTVNNALVNLLLKKDTLLKTYTLRHPEVMAISNEIIENARKMLILLQLQIHDMEKKHVDLKRELAKFDRKIQLLMDKKLEFDRLKRKVQLHHDMTTLLEKKNQEALITKAEKPEEVIIVKPALLSRAPINPPKTATNAAMGVMIGMILGLAIAFMMETFDTSLGAIEDVEETLGTQVLGVIPHADDRDIQDRLKDRYPQGVPLSLMKQMSYLRSHFDPKSMMAENFRALRTNIQFKDNEKETRAFVVTSTSPKEGKTIVTINLAITMAQAGMKILLVGSDMRRPMLGKVFGVEETPGLRDILLGNYRWTDTVKGITDVIMGKMNLDDVMITPGLDNLYIITGGSVPPNPAELMDSDLLTDFLEEAKEEYDMVLFDSPPVLSAADAAILGTKVDGVLLVYRVGNVSRGLLKRSTAQLEQINCQITGVVLNGMRPEVSPDFHDYKYYRNYYYSYGGEDEEKEARSYKKVFSFAKHKDDSQSSSEEKISPASVRKVARPRQGKRLNPMKWSLIGVSLIFLSSGLLWHNGIMDPLKLFHLKRWVIADQVKSSAKKGPANKTPEKEPEVIPEKPKVKTRTKEPKLPAEAPTPQAPTAAGIRADIEEMGIQGKFPSYPYSVQLGSYPSLERAERAISIYLKRGLPSYLVKVDLKKKGVWYRVFAGHFEDPQQAERFKKKHGLSEAVVNKSPYVNVIGIKSYAWKGTGLEAEIPTPESPTVAREGVDIEEPSNPKKFPSFPYSIRLGSYPSLERAKKAADMYGKKGLFAYWAKVELSKGVWYRVFTGHFKDLQQAERFRKEHGLTEAKVNKAPYANLIGIYSYGDEVDNQILLLKKLGHSPYVINGPDGESQLFVGAFLTKAGAERQGHELRSNGIQSQVVQR
jgi:capsular exopolysaccharide synthesis family protein